MYAVVYPTVYVSCSSYLEKKDLKVEEKALSYTFILAQDISGMFFKICELDSEPFMDLIWLMSLGTLEAKWWL